ncbi:MAG: dehydratase [Chloroflexi bacterium]|nr:dehydratase [Chloroflexota bacterium]
MTTARGTATAAQLFFEDVAVGMLLPTGVKGPVRLKDLVKWAGAIEDYNEIHFDADFAQARGLPGPIIHGPLKAAVLAQMLVDWIGPAGILKKLACQYRRMDVVGETLTYRGRVTKTAVENGEYLVECLVWVENSRGEVTTRGSALVALPGRGG